jgi:DNA invertase Pin-like site-specific DNA recombinase
LQRLLEFCALTDTLVIDTDGVYDLQDFNDRLLLGLKSQMSEAELHMITARLQGAKRAAAERGELRFPLAIGFGSTSRASGSSILTRRCRRRSPTCSLRSLRPARRTGSSARSRAGGPEADVGR